MGDDDHGDFLIREEALEVFAKENVEVVGWFVEQEEVGLVGEQDGEFEAALLSVAEGFNLAVHELGGEEEVGEDAAAAAVFDASVVAEFFEHGFFGIEF